MNDDVFSIAKYAPEILIERFQVIVISDPFLHFFIHNKPKHDKIVYLYFTSFKYFVLIWYWLLSIKYIIFLKEARVVTKWECSTKRSLLYNSLWNIIVITRSSRHYLEIYLMKIWLRSAIIDSHQDNKNLEIWRETFYIEDRKPRCSISASS